MIQSPEPQELSAHYVVPTPSPLGADLRPFPDRLASPHVLVIDANIGSLDYFGRLFSGQGFSVTLSTALLDADVLDAVSPDVILLDVTRESHREALAFAHRVTRGALLRGVPLVCMTGDPGVARQLTSEDRCPLIKPVGPFDLFVAIDNSLGLGDGAPLLRRRAS